MRRLLADEVSFNSVISVCEQCCQWQIALDVFSTMMTSMLLPNLITFNSTISACSKASQPSKGIGTDTCHEGTAFASRYYQLQQHHHSRYWANEWLAKILSDVGWFDTWHATEGSWKCGCHWHLKRERLKVEGWLVDGVWTVVIDHVNLWTYVPRKLDGFPSHRDAHLQKTQVMFESKKRRLWRTYPSSTGSEKHGKVDPDHDTVLSSGVPISKPVDVWW